MQYRILIKFELDNTSSDSFNRFWNNEDCLIIRYWGWHINNDKTCFVSSRLNFEWNNKFVDLKKKKYWHTINEMKYYACT